MSEHSYLKWIHRTTFIHDYNFFFFFPEEKCKRNVRNITIKALLLIFGVTMNLYSKRDGYITLKVSSNEFQTSYMFDPQIKNVYHYSLIISNYL